MNQDTKDNLTTAGIGAAGTTAGAYAAGAKLAADSVKNTNARIDPVASRATQRIADANKTIEGLAQKYGNRAIPRGHADLKALQDAIAVRDANIARVKGLSGLRPELSEVGQAFVKERGGAAAARLSSAANKVLTLGGALEAKAGEGMLKGGAKMLGRGGMNVGAFALADWAMRKGLTTDETVRLERLMNGLKYGQAVSNEELRKLKSVKETGLIGEHGLSEEEVANYFHKNKGIWDNQMGGWYNKLKMGGQLISGLFSPAGSAASSGLQMHLEEGANDAYFNAMAGSLESQAKQRQWRNEQDKRLGEDFARGLYGEHRPLQNMDGIGGNASGPTVEAYDPNAAAKRKAGIDYATNSDNIGAASAMVGQNAAKNGGQRWYQDVEEAAQRLSNPDDQRKLRLGMMYQQGLISQDDYMQAAHGMSPEQYMTQGVSQIAPEQPKATAQPAPTVQQGVVANASGPTTEVNPNVVRVPNQPTQQGQAGMEEAMRMRAIASGERNVDGAVGQSMKAYFKSRGIKTAAEFDAEVNSKANAMYNKAFGTDLPVTTSDASNKAFADAMGRLVGRKSYWGDNNTNAPAAGTPAPVTQGPSTLDNGVRYHTVNGKTVEIGPNYYSGTPQQQGTQSVANGVVANAASPTAEVKQPPMFGVLPAGADPNNRFANPAYKAAVWSNLRARSDAEHTGMTTDEYVQQGIDMENASRNQPASGLAFNPASAIRRGPMVSPPSNTPEYSDGHMDEEGIWHDNPSYIDYSRLHADSLGVNPYRKPKSLAPKQPPMNPMGGSIGKGFGGPY